MTGTKVLIIVLVVIVVLFVVFVVVGADKHPKTTQQSNNAQGTKIAHQPPGYLKGLDALLGSSGPKVDAAHRYPSLTTFDLQKQASYTIKVLPDSSHTFRQAKIEVQPPTACAHIVFQPSGEAPKELSQDSDNIDDVTKRNEIKLTVAKEGGTLVISRKLSMNTAPCMITLE